MGDMNEEGLGEEKGGMETKMAPKREEEQAERSQKTRRWRVSGAEWVQRAEGTEVPCSQSWMQQDASRKGGASF